MTITSRERASGLSGTLPDGFSQPYRAGELYPQPPYRYRGAESLSLVYEAKAAPIRTMLPPGVSIDAELATVSLVASTYQRTPFGAYREFYFTVLVDFNGEKYMYSPVMYADNEGAFAAGRELWGFAKKTAVMDFRITSGQWTFSATRHDGLPLIDLSVACQATDLPAAAQSVAHPTMTMKLIPGGSPGHPAVAQLIATHNKKAMHKDAFGDPDRWSGRAAVAIQAASATDSLTPFLPEGECIGWYSHYDCDLPAGEVIWDYLTGK